MQPSVVRDEPWYLRAFERIYLHVYPHRDDEEAERNTPAILELLGLRANQRVLDLGCGAGRYARAMARRGLQVTGVDLSQDLLEAAHELSPDTPGRPTYVRADMRDLPFFGQFDGAVSLFTSFGYFDTREDDLSVLQGVHRALVPGARFLLDFLNAEQIRAGLEPASETQTDRFRLQIERWIDEDGAGGPRVHKRVRAAWRDTGLPATTFEEQVRLYTAHEIDELLEEAGFGLVEEAYGGFEREPFQPASARYIRVARR
jgi:SAM-dependent methyltransferase